MALPVGIVAVACSGQPGAELGQSEPESSAAVSATLERIDAGGGVEIQLLNDELNGVLGTAVIGPESAKDRTSMLAQVQGGPLALYRAALPDREAPEHVVAFDALTREMVELGQVESVPAAPGIAAEAAPIEDARAERVAKSASSFPGQFCGDQIDKQCLFSGWAPIQNGCFTTRTNDWTKQLDTVRQGFAALEMQVGTANLQSEWWDSANQRWVGFHNVAVAQGRNTSVRLWQQNTTPGWYRFKVVGAAGDTYHVAVQSADTPLTEMTLKTTDPTQKYRIRCDCVDFGRLSATYFVDACLRQPTGVFLNREWPTHNDAFAICALRCDDQVITQRATENGVAFTPISGSQGCTANLSYVNR